MNRRIALVVSAMTGKDLTGGTQDAARVYTLLTRPELGSCDAQRSSLLNDCPLSTTFEAATKKVLQSWDPGDQLVFYFSGHGDLKGNQFCLYFGEDLKDFATFQGLLSNFEACGVTRAVIILDACHSGAALSSFKNKAENRLGLPSQEIPDGIALLCSCRSAEQSYELDDGSASVFTRLFCEEIESGLNGTPTQGGIITIADIITAVNEKISNDVKYSAYGQSAVYDIHGADRSLWISKNLSGELPSPGSQRVSSVEELEFLYAKAAAWRRPCAGAEIADLNLELVQNYAEARQLASANRSDKKALIVELGLYSPLCVSDRQTLHTAAVLCFCRQPDKFIPQARSVFVSGEPGDSGFTRTDITGPLCKQVSQLVTLTMRHLETVSSFEKDGGLRTDMDEIDRDVVRELISNAIAHRDYSASSTVQVRVDSSALTVTNPGKFPSGISWSQLLQSPSSSYPVDEAIALYLSGQLVFEGIGRGFRVFQNYISTHGEESMVYEELSGPSISIRVNRPKPRIQQAVDRDASQRKLFAHAQLLVDTEEKRCVAKWAAKHFPIISGTEVVLDAGSSCTAMWSEILNQVSTSQISHLTVLTNNFMVLEAWFSYLERPQLIGTTIQLLGGILDTPHLAFYGPEATDKLMSNSNQLSTVYIGTSQIAFDQNGKILFCYHAGDEERQLKEALFQCHAKARVILATTRKIGPAMGQSIDVLSIPNLNTSIPLYLVTPAPTKGSNEEDNFEQAKRTLGNDQFIRSINDKGLDFQWIIIDRETLQILEHLRVLTYGASKDVNAGS